MIKIFYLVDMMERYFKIALILIINLLTVNQSQAITFGGKVGFNSSSAKLKSNDSGAVFGKNKGDNEYSSKGKVNLPIEAFVAKSLFDNNVIFVEAEGSILVNGKKTTIDANSGKMPKSFINELKVKEKFAGALCLNGGINIANDIKVYGKVGGKISRLNIKQIYNPDPKKTSITKSENKISTSLLLGIGASKQISDSLKIIAEGIYTMTPGTKAQDFDAKADTAGATLLNASFKGRKIKLSDFGLKIGFGIAL